MNVLRKHSTFYRSHGVIALQRKVILVTSRLCILIQRLSLNGSHVQTHLKIDDTCRNWNFIVILIYWLRSTATSWRLHSGLELISQHIWNFTSARWTGVSAGGEWRRQGRRVELWGWCVNAKAIVKCALTHFNLCYW